MLIVFENDLSWLDKDILAVASSVPFDRIQGRLFAKYHAKLRVKYEVSAVHLVKVLLQLENTYLVVELLRNNLQVLFLYHSFFTKFMVVSTELF